jgi:hypothetical protein
MIRLIIFLFAILVSGIAITPYAAPTMAAHTFLAQQGDFESNPSFPILNRRISGFIDGIFFLTQEKIVASKVVMQKF